MTPVQPLSDHPKKWRESADPFAIPYRNIKLLRVLGYPHAGNDVFEALVLVQGEEHRVYIKIARQQPGADLAREAAILPQLNRALPVPKVLEYGTEPVEYLVCEALEGKRLSKILPPEEPAPELFLHRYGAMLARLHALTPEVGAVRDRWQFRLPPTEQLGGIFAPYLDYLQSHRPANVTETFIHGDFHYANVLWKNEKISAILDFELCGIGWREFDLAWAILLRPGQTFLKSQKERDAFLQGYGSLADFSLPAFQYYHTLIAAHFYMVGLRTNDVPYQQDLLMCVREVLNA